MKTPIQIFKKHGAYYYENDEQEIIDAMSEYAKQDAMEFLEWKDGCNLYKMNGEYYTHEGLIKCSISDLYAKFDAERNQNKKCVEGNCKEMATKDYNGHGHWVCDRHYEKLSNDFDNGEF